MLAIDLGGTRVKVGLVDDGQVRELVVADHRSDTLSGALDCLARLVAELVPSGCDRVGMCVPGLVDDAGTVVALPGKLDGAIGADLVGWLQSRTGGRARIANDAIAYGMGEAYDAPGRTVVMTIGTGVGTAVVEDGRPLGRGALGGGLLGGQLPLTGGGPTDSSGCAGTIEVWCRADRILAEAHAAGADVADVPAALAAAAAGDAAARRGLHAYRGWLARGIAALCLAHAPDAVVVGGGPIRADGLLLEGVQQLVEPLLWPGQTVQVRPARHGDAAALLGLAVLA